MGLLQKLSDQGLESKKVEQPLQDKPVIQKKSNSVGLLKKSLMAGEPHRLDFFEFAGKHNLEIAAILKNKNNTYRIENCIGFDGESICLSVSTFDFWQGTITNENQIYSYNASSSEALPFFQFFSKKLQDKIQAIHIIKTNNNSIFFICNKDIQATTDFIKDLEGVENTEVTFEKSSALQNQNFSNSYIIDFSEALESFVLSNSKNDIQFTKVIINEIYNNLCISFPEPQAIEYSVKGQFTLRLSEELPVELIYNHIRIESSFILGNHSELLSIRKSLEAAQ